MLSRMGKIVPVIDSEIYTYVVILLSYLLLTSINFFEVIWAIFLFKERFKKDSNVSQNNVIMTVGKSERELTCIKFKNATLFP